MFVDTPGDFASKTFDFVVVGGGTAGLALAARLTEDPELTVGVLEAGQNRIVDPNILVPGLAFNLEGHADYDWLFSSTPQKSLGGRIISLPRGKVLGGSSAINGMVSTYPSREDIDRWAELGNEGWSFDDLEPYFRTSERFDAPSQKIAQFYETEDIINPELHKIKGPVATSFPVNRRVGADAWVKTFENVGLKLTTDPLSGEGLGGYTNLTTIDASSSTRSYAATAYFAPNIGRPNLTVLTEAQVNKITFSPHSLPIHATGVSFSSKGSDYHVKASREVILCAGAFQSPQILELSGIGSFSILTPLGIDVVVDNPNVGENLQEQPFVPLSWEAADGIVTLDSLQIPGAINAALAQFYANQTGLLTSFIQSSAYLSFEQIGGHASAVTKTNDPTSPRYQVPSLHKQFELQKVSLKDSNDTTAMIILLEEGLPLPTAPGVPPVIASGNFFSASSILCHPFSRGSVHITSKDPTAAPSIDLNYLSHPLDIAILELATFFLQELVTKEPFASKLKDGGKAFYPGYHHLTKENADAWCKQTLNTSDHPTSSCSMLPKEEGGVVDEKLRVYGVTNLRVVDASVFPMSIRSNPVMTVYAVAEKAADIIKSDWRGRGYKREATGAELNGKVGKKSKRA